MATRKPALTTAGVRAAWGGHCLCATATPFRFWNGSTINMDPRTHGALEAMDSIMDQYHYAPTPPDIGGCVCRAITGGSLLSLHAFCAWDCNWQANPYFTYPAPRAGHCDMPVAMTDAICALTTRSDAPVWGWGGNYTSIKDYMHFEVVCTPADLASGIVGGTMSKQEQLLWFIKAGKEAQHFPFLRFGDSGAAVKTAQKMLGLPEPLSGHFGVGTKNKVAALQAFCKIRHPHAHAGMTINHTTWQWLIFNTVTKGRR
jgi:hypothetical protein